MDVLNDFPSHRSVLHDYAEPSDSKECSSKFWQPALLRVLDVESHMSSFPPGSTASSRTSSQISFVHDTKGQDLPDKSTVKQKGRPLPTSSPLSCEPHIRKLPKRKWTPSVNQASNGESVSFLSGSPIQSLKFEEAGYHNCSAFLVDPPVTKILSHVVIANQACASPGTSITVEEQLLQSSSSVQSASDDEPFHPYVNSPLKSATRTHGCSDGSASSDSPEGCDFDQLMEFMLDESNQMGLPFEMQFTQPMEAPMSCQSSVQHPVYGYHLGGSSDFRQGGSDQNKWKSPVWTNTNDEHDIKISQGSMSLTEGLTGKGGLGKQNYFMQDAGAWDSYKKDSTGLEEIFSHPQNLVQETATSNEAFSPMGRSRIHVGGQNIGSTHESNWPLPLPPYDAFAAEAGAYSSSVSPRNKQSRKDDFGGGLLDGFLQSPGFGSKVYSGEEISKLCDSIALRASGQGSFQYKSGTHVGPSRELGFKREIPILDSQNVGLQSEADYSGICLVHLLIAGAEAVATRDMDLASVILARLKELASCAGNTMQRVAAYFSDGLQCRIEGGRAVNRAANNAFNSDIVAAFQILHEISPYIKFGHFTANQAILEAVEGEKRVHIVDFEIMEGIQWPSLMQALVSREGGPPQLRITALLRSHVKTGLAMVQETGKRLSEFASSLNLPFTFSQVRVDSEDEFRVSTLKLIKGEALVVNCMVHLPHMPHRTATSLCSFLQGMRKLSPLILTLVEEELGCNATAVASYFFEALHHYSAIFDSLEACLSSETVARTLIERIFLAPRISSTVTFWSGSSARAELGVEFATHNWCSLVRSVGFKSLPLSFYNLTQARLLLGLFRDGFKLEEISNRLLLGWRSKPLFAASAWN